MGNVMVIPAKRQVGNTARQQDAKPKLIETYSQCSTFVGRSEIYALGI